MYFISPGKNGFEGWNRPERIAQKTKVKVEAVVLPKPEE